MVVEYENWIQVERSAWREILVAAMAQNALGDSSLQKEAAAIMRLSPQLKKVVKTGAFHQQARKLMYARGA